MTLKNNYTPFSNSCEISSRLSVSNLRTITLSGSFYIEESASHLLILSQKGLGQLVDNTKSRILIPENSVYFFHNTKSSTLRPSSPNWELVLLSMNGDLCNFFLTHFESIFAAPRILSSGSMIQNSIEKLLQTSNITHDTVDILRFKLLTDIFTELCIQDQDFAITDASIPSYVQALKNAIDSEYAYDFSLEKYEFILKISKYRLCREFSRCYEISPLQYLNHVRLEHAKNLLLTTDLTVKEIGSSVGIQNTNHFINLFKRETGCTPQAFRRETQQPIALLHYPYTPDVPL